MKTTTTHFDEIKDELRQLYTIEKNIVLLLWLPRLYGVIKNRIHGSEKKVGFLDCYNLDGLDISVINVSNASQCIDFLNFAKHFNCQNIVGIGLAGAYDLSLGTIFVPEKAISEEPLTSYFTSEKTGSFDRALFEANKKPLEEFASAVKSKMATGTTVSLDLFSRETEGFKAQYRTTVDTIELEVAPLYLMANLLGIRCVSVLIISDNLDRSYFLRQPDEISVVHRIYDSIPDLILKLEFPESRCGSD